MRHANGCAAGWVEVWTCDGCGDEFYDSEPGDCFEDPDTQETFCEDCVQSYAPHLYDAWCAENEEVEA